MTDTQSHRTSDRLELAERDRQQAFEDVMDAATTLQRDYLEFLTRLWAWSFPQFTKYLPNQS